MRVTQRRMHRGTSVGTNRRATRRAIRVCRLAAPCCCRSQPSWRRLSSHERLHFYARAGIRSVGVNVVRRISAMFARNTPMLAIAVLVCFAAELAMAQQASPLTAVPPKEGDFVAQKFTFADGESLPEIRMHYTTIGTPQHDASGHVTNAVVILHGTNRKGGVFLVPSFAGVLFGHDQLLDASRYYLILPDQFGAGLGKSTKPSDGLRARFPHYDYADMIAAVRLMLRDGLHVDHLRLLLGSSMGCMQGFMWAESNPDDIDALMALSCLPTQVAGRNRMVRKLMIDDVRLDPGYNHGNYKRQPYGLRAALGHLLVVASAPTLWQAEY